MLSSRGAAGTYGMQVNAVYYKAVARAASSIHERECKCDALCCNVDVYDFAYVLANRLFGRISLHVKSIFR